MWASDASTAVSDEPAFIAMHERHRGRSRISAVMRAVVCGIAGPLVEKGAPELS